MPVVAQDRLTGEVRMLAYADAEAVRQTLATGRATFFSRSRGVPWVKGETSGNVLVTSDVIVDCDGDALVYLVTPFGPTCHTGKPSCFFRKVALGEDGATLEQREPVPATTLLARLEAILEARRSAEADASYVRSLYDGGAELIGKKLREEADELARAVASEDDTRVTSEAADVLFHLCVALGSRKVALTTVLDELERRFGKSGHDEKRSRAPAPQKP